MKNIIGIFLLFQQGLFGLNVPLTRSLPFTRGLTPEADLTLPPPLEILVIIPSLSSLGL